MGLRVVVKYGMVIHLIFVSFKYCFLSSNFQYPKSYLPLMSPSHSVSHCDSYTSHCDSYTTDVQRKFLLFCVESLWRCLKSTAEEVHGRFDYRITT